MSQPSTEPGAQPEPALAARVADMLWGYQRTQMLYVAAELGLADLIAQGFQPVDALAAATGTHAPSLYRLLRALAGDGVFAEREDGRFELTPLAALLRSDTPGSMRAMVLAEGRDFYPLWGELLHCVQTGETVFERVYGMSNWEYRVRHPEVNARFNAYMADMTRQKATEVLAHYRFPESGVVVDVGGGDGTFLVALLRRYPSLRGVLFDLPHVVERAAAGLAEAGVAGRCEVVAGDFFEAVPEGGDIYVLATVLHDWSDERAADIIRRCRQAMAPDATLLVIERVMPAGNLPSVAKLRDMHMLVSNAGGRERTEREWRTVLEAGGFRLRALTATGLTYYALEAVPA